MTLNIQPITLSEARLYVDRHHRHHQAPQGGLFAIGINDGEKVRGVVIVGRPVARMLQDGYTAEVTRLCTDGVRNGCSMLYGAAWRAARAMGYRKLITYTLDTEDGSSLKASNWRVVGEVNGRSWDTPTSGRPRVDKHPTQNKLRWEIS